ncbi:MAG: hypothetical protein AAGA92_12105 [Planctomycetota bacterium]
MANVMRWRYGDTNPVMAPADSSLIEVGDLVALSSGSAVSAGTFANLGSEPANQEAFHDSFLGVAMQQSPEGETQSIRVATSGVFEFLSASATYGIGDLLGTHEPVSGAELYNQSIATVLSPSLAIGRCVRSQPQAAAKVLVDVVSTVVRGGPQAAA